MSFWDWLLGRKREADSPAVLPHVVIPVEPEQPKAWADTRHMLVPADAVALVKQWEGFRAKPYRCPAGVPTIGYGSTFYADGRRVTMDDPPITEEAASALLYAVMTRFAADVDRLVKVPLTAGQRGALISFTFNLGAGALSQSTLLRKLNAGDYEGAANEFQRWNRAGSSILEGLTRRRAAEAAMFRGK